MEGFRPPDIKLETIWRTVLVTDARNSSKAYFSEKADEALVRIERDRALFLQIAVAHDGEEVRDRGDGSMFAFCDPVEAVRAAMAMQAEIARLNRDLPPESLRLVHRMGVHTGEIKLATTRIALGGRETVRRKLSGDIVVTASRLEGICHPGEVCFSNDVYKAIRGRIDHEFRHLDSTMKGFDRPVRCWSSRLDRDWARPLTAEEELGKQRRKDEARLRETWEAEQREKTRRRRLLRVVAPVALLCVAVPAAQVAWANESLRRAVAEWLAGHIDAPATIDFVRGGPAPATSIDAPPMRETSLTQPHATGTTAPHPHRKSHSVAPKANVVPEDAHEQAVKIVKGAFDTGDFGSIRERLAEIEPSLPDFEKISAAADAVETWKDWFAKSLEDDGVEAKEISQPIQGLHALVKIDEQGVWGTDKSGTKACAPYADIKPSDLDAFTRTETDQGQKVDASVEDAPRSLGVLRLFAGM